MNTSGWTVPSPYATSSHSWGKKTFLHLISRNIDLLKNEVPVDQLTKTFSEAIAITRRVGLDYV
jgi:hypothetical protein